MNTLNANEKVLIKMENLMVDKDMSVKDVDEVFIRHSYKGCTFLLPPWNLSKYTIINIQIYESIYKRAANLIV